MAAQSGGIVGIVTDHLGRPMFLDLGRRFSPLLSPRPREGENRWRGRGGAGDPVSRVPAFLVDRRLPEPLLFAAPPDVRQDGGRRAVGRLPTASFLGATLLAPLLLLLEVGLLRQ